MSKKALESDKINGVSAPVVSLRPIAERIAAGAFIPNKEGGAKQAFASESDINNIVQRFLSTGAIPPPNGVPVYADMTKVPATLFEAVQSLNHSHSIISKLPDDLRNAFMANPIGTLNSVLAQLEKGSGGSGAGSAPSSKPVVPGDKDNSPTGGSTAPNGAEGGKGA